MTNPSFEKEIVEQLKRLASEQQRRVLDFVRSLARARPLGVPGKELLPFAGTIEVSDLQAMSQAIEAGCEQVDRNEW